MKKLIAALLVLVVFSIGLDVIVRLNKAERPLQANGNRPLRTPISTMLRNIRKHGGRISEDEAKAVSLEIWKELWGSEIKAEVKSCEWDEHPGLWTVSVVIVDPTNQSTASPSGCEVTLSDLGDLDKVQYCGGM